MTEWELQSERPGEQKERREEEGKRRKTKKRWKSLGRISLPSGNSWEEAEIDLWLRVSLLFSLYSPDRWDCRKVWSSESLWHSQTHADWEGHRDTHTQSDCGIVNFMFLPHILCCILLCLPFFFSALLQYTVHVRLKIAADFLGWIRGKLQHSFL